VSPNLIGNAELLRFNTIPIQKVSQKRFDQLVLLSATAKIQEM